MDFTNTFTVKAPMEQVWDFMTQAHEVAPCVPGAAITEVIDDTHYKGSVKVKLGAIQMSFQGELEMQPNEAEHVMILKAKGTETRGRGGASGAVTTTLTTTDDGSTYVEILSHVDVTGRVAQFGRGIMQDVSNRLIKDFAHCVERKLESGDRSVAPESPAIVEAETTAADPASEVAPSGRSESSPPPSPEPAVAQAQPSPAQAQPSPAPTQTSSPSVSAPTAVELNLQRLILDLIRSRLAVGLRKLAQLVEPD